MHHDKLKHNYHKINYHDHDRMLKMVHHWHYPMVMKANHQLLKLMIDIERFVIYNFDFHYLMKIFHIQLYGLDYSKVVNQHEV
jgi:hypothetical protein